MNITVFGASGRTGVPLVRQAIDRGHDVVGFVRDPDRFPFEDDRLTLVAGGAYGGDGVREAVAGADAVVSVLGQTDDGPDDLLTVAGEHILAAMEAEGVDRFVTLTGAGVRTEGESVPLSGRVMGVLLKLLQGEVLADAERHVDLVRASGTDWTVVRAPRLTDGPRTGEYRAGDIELGFESVSRADVADFLLDCVEEGRHARELPKIGGA
ncbi:NAD(P)-dependent oxidoreductase [Halostella litorea]|uniref:NAD(P)-dependent oxidoreductase n=1 Tax=Halostella litorea TaxID=2528831 RepID=UPI001091CDE7|nr:NAD(P)H-binding protein [Halostella litorea]